MMPTAVLVLVAGVSVVLAVAGAALALDARRRRAAAPPSLPAAGSRPFPVNARQTEPIDSTRAQQDPPTAAIPRPDDRADPEDRAGPT